MTIFVQGFPDNPQPRMVGAFFVEHQFINIIDSTYGDGYVML